MYFLEENILKYSGHKNVYQTSKIKMISQVKIYKSTHLQEVNIKTLMSSNRINKLMFAYLLNTDWNYWLKLLIETTDWNYWLKLLIETTDWNYWLKLLIDTTDWHYRLTLQINTTDWHYSLKLLIETTDWT